MLDVGPHRRSADAEPLGNGARCVSAGKKAQNLQLPWCHSLPLPEKAALGGSQNTDGDVTARNTPEIEAMIPQGELRMTRGIQSLRQHRGGTTWTATQTLCPFESANSFPAGPTDDIPQQPSRRVVLGDYGPISIQDGESGSFPADQTCSVL